MEWFHLSEVFSFLTDKESIDLIKSYLECIVIARIALKKEETPDDSSKV